MEGTKQKVKRRKNIQASAAGEGTGPSTSPSQAFLIHLVCGLGLASAFWVANNVYSIDLVSDPSRTLRLIWVIEIPIVILLYSLFRYDPNHCSYLRAVGRGLLCLPAGALVNAFGAIVLGAPVGIQHFSKTVNWSLLMSVCTFVPAACVFGSSWTDWHRILAHEKPFRLTDYMISLPAHGVIIGAWFGAFPMPLDWERPWQEWPICVTYGAMAGYLIGSLASLGFVLFHGRQQRVKED